MRTGKYVVQFGCGGRQSVLLGIIACGGLIRKKAEIHCYMLMGVSPLAGSYLLAGVDEGDFVKHNFGISWCLFVFSTILLEHRHLLVNDFKLASCRNPFIISNEHIYTTTVPLHSTHSWRFFYLLEIPYCILQLAMSCQKVIVCQKVIAEGLQPVKMYYPVYSLQLLLSGPNTQDMNIYISQCL